jgi:hypothetical protein
MKNVNRCGKDELKVRIECAAIMADYNKPLNKDTTLKDSKNLAYSLISEIKL